MVLGAAVLAGGALSTLLAAAPAAGVGAAQPEKAVALFNGCDLAG